MPGVQWNPEEAIGSGVPDDCELPCGWELNLGRLEEWQVLLITEPSLTHVKQLLYIFLKQDLADQAGFNLGILLLELQSHGSRPN